MFVTRAVAKSLREEVELAVAKIAKKHGMKLELGNGTFTASDFAVRVKMVEAGKITIPKQFRDRPLTFGLVVNQMAKQLGLPEDIVGQKFNHKTKTLTVIALAPNRPKNSVSLEDQNGKKFKCSADMLKTMMNI